MGLMDIVNGDGIEGIEDMIGGIMGIDGTGDIDMIGGIMDVDGIEDIDMIGMGIVGGEGMGSSFPD